MLSRRTPMRPSATTLAESLLVQIQGRKDDASNFSDTIDVLRGRITEMVEAYGEMEKGIDDPILCHYNGTRLHNAMEDLRAMVLPDYTPKYEPSLEEAEEPESDSDRAQRLQDEQDEADMPG